MSLWATIVKNHRHFAHDRAHGGMGLVHYVTFPSNSFCSCLYKQEEGARECRLKAILRIFTHLNICVPKLVWDFPRL